jgi:hypothetical protein
MTTYVFALFAMGILYDNEETIEPGTPVDQSSPMFVIRPYRRPKRSRRSTWRPLPLNLSVSGLSNDADIARLLFPCTSNTQTTPNHDLPIPIPPLSLPQLLESHLMPISSSPLDLHSGDWTFVNTDTLDVSTPSSEPETWITVNDDS